MKRIAHFGSYDANVGDNIALLNIRKGVEKALQSEVSWKSVCISKFHNSPGGMNNIEYIKHKFGQINEQNDMLIIGGGGLIESNNRPDNQTKWKLPFTEETLSELTIPIVCFSMGINYFRNYPKLDDNATRSLKSLQEHSTLFSLRNDGSVDIYKDIFNKECEELPDPGLIFDIEHIMDRKQRIQKGFFQPAWNNNRIQMVGRGYSLENLQKMCAYCDFNNLKIMPHTKKDYNFPYKDFIYKNHEFSKLVSFKDFEKIIQKYHDYDYSVAMRGHGQLISIGLGLPSIYFSTQDKVENFSLRNGFEDYNVDIRQDNWFELLQKKTTKIKNNPHYLEKWYEKREQLMLKCNEKFNSFCSRIVEELK